MKAKPSWDPTLLTRRAVTHAALMRVDRRVRRARLRAGNRERQDAERPKVEILPKFVMDILRGKKEAKPT